MYTPEMWRGVVAVTQAESSLILHERSMESDDALIYDLAIQALDNAPYLEDVLTYASKFYREVESDDTLLSPKHIETFISGVNDGFYYMLGCTAFVLAHRLENEITLSQRVRHRLPVQNKEELRRVKQVISGDAPVEMSHYETNPDFTSSDLPQEELNEYIFSYPHLADHIHTAAGNISYPNSEGFSTGIELFYTCLIQSAEERAAISLKL